MLVRRPESVSTSTSSSRASLWTKLNTSSTSDSLASSHHASPSPSARSGHAMTYLPPTRSILLFGGADGKVFFQDIFLLDVCRSRMSTTNHNNSIQWQKLVVSRRTTNPSQSLPSPGSEAGKAVHVPTLVQSGGGRDYHTMHYVQTSVEEEKARGMRVLVIGNLVVAHSDETVGCGPHGTQTEHSALTFDTLTLRVEELVINQSTLEAQWETRRVDAASMWKPRARHAHSSVVVNGDQVFVFGGKDATSSVFFNDIFYYDAALNQWIEPQGHPTGSLPQARAFAGLTASNDGKTLFLFGGTDGKQEFGSLYLYDVRQNRWDSLLGATSGDRPSCRINHSLTFVAPHHLVLFGGRRRAVRQNELYLYNVKTRGWRLVHGQSDNDVAEDDQTPIGRTAHTTVSIPADSMESQELIVFGGYAGSHQWLDDLYLLSLSPGELMHQAASRTSSSSRAWLPSDVSFNQAPARLVLTAPQQSMPMHRSSHSTRVQEPSTQPVDVAHSASFSSQSTDEVPLSSVTSDTHERAPTATGGTELGVLSDITNQTDGKKRQQQQVVASSGRNEETSPGTIKKRKRWRQGEESQESNSGSNRQLTTAQVGIQTTLLQLLQHQPRVEETLGRILAMLTKEQKTRHQQGMNLETLMRVHSDEQRARLEAATRQNEALERRLARSEAERASLQEKLMARETELFVHKQSLEAAIAPLKERVQAIESSHRQQFKVSRVIESKISAVHDFMDELRNAGGEATEADESPEGRQGRSEGSVATQPTPSPSKSLLYSQRVVVALQEKIRVLQTEKETLETQLKEMTDKFKRIERREAQARDFLSSWCQGETSPVHSMPTRSSTEPAAGKDTDTITNPVMKQKYT